jgi:hypothetical protein
MPSPFPGMNPYLEQDDAWHDFHERFISLIADLLVIQVRPNYIVKIDEHVYVHEFPTEPRQFRGRADVSLGRIREPGQIEPQVGLLEPPMHVQLPALDVESLGFVEIRDRHKRELVCVIELLSPANKRPGPDREQYLSKRRQLLSSRANFVEIDLLRGGKPMPPEDRHPCDYSVMVSRAEDRPQAGFWPVALRGRLPSIPIPLRDPDPPARLNLQEALHRLYDAAGYEDYIYDGIPEPPLSPDEASWAAAFVPVSGS